MNQPLFHINPDRNKPWNDLPDLPIHPDLYRTVEVMEQLANTKSALGRLHGRSIAIPNQGVLINTISLQEAKASSEIENIFTTDDELYQAYSEEGEDVSIKGAPKEVLRYREALWAGHQHLMDHGTFDMDYFIRIYRLVKQTNDGIRPSSAHIYIKQGGTGPNAGTAIYTPPRGKGIIEQKLQNLLEFVNDDEKYPIDPLIKMAIAHYQFEVIHPFRDGNGRAGRIYNINILTQKGLLDLPILFLSRYIIDNKNDYYSHLASVTQRAMWERWILFMLKAVEVTANLTFNKINDIISAKEGILEAIQGDTKIRKSEMLVQMIFTQPLTKVSHLTDAKIFAENTARNYLNELVELGILEKRTISGHHYYLNLELYRILSE
ncbi:MAG: Fic/DOC family N-terminal domain-containing protein [Ekhidna sp.]|uniref:Fic family protein n=1 Tax=Ekhidna sp. TaxID=2608089 RepID=UPI0032EC1D56